MAEYADRICCLKLYTELQGAAGRDDIPQSDVDELAGMVLRVADAIGPVLKRIPLTFRQYTDHDLTHCCNVIGLMGCFIPPATLEQLNALESALLLLAGLLHDVGMVVTDAEKQEALASPEFARFRQGQVDRNAAIDKARCENNEFRARAIEDAVLAEYSRRLHPQRARAYIDARLAADLRFRNADISDHVATLCESHDWGMRETRDSRDPDAVVAKLPRKKPVYGVPVNLQYLACCLRLGDILDFDRSRTPLSVFEHLDFTEKKSWLEWSKHLAVEGWSIEEREVAFEASCTQPVLYVAVHEFLDQVDAELRECRYLIDEAPKKIAERYELHLPHVVDRRGVAMRDKTYLAGAFRFQLEFDEIMRLLMDKSLYPDPSLFLRELLQNALDACRHREALWKEAGCPGSYKPRIVVWDHSDDPADPRVVFQDNGMGMSREIVENYFMRVGKSYYRSPEFDGEKQRLQAAGVDLEACSCFGIGILSCFLLGDRFEIETYRFGHEPLHITVEGPSRYFVIRRLPRPDTREFQPTAAADEEAGPLVTSGTRVTVHLRPGAKVDARETIAAFAVNVDYGIRVHRPSGRVAVVQRGGWECRNIVPGLPPITHIHVRTGARWSETDPSEANLQSVVAASRVPFERWAFSCHLKGGAWFWLLRDGLGITPKRGYLQVGFRLECVGLPRFVEDAVDCSYFLYGDEFWEDGDFRRELQKPPGADACPLAAALREKLAPLKEARLDLSLGLDHLAGDLEWRWKGLTAREKQRARRSLLAWRPGRSGTWLQVAGLADALAEGRLPRGWTRVASYRYELLAQLTPQEVAVPGLRCPRGIPLPDPEQRPSES